MGWLSVFSALACLFDSLSGLYRDWRLRRAGALRKAVYLPSRTPRDVPGGGLKLWSTLTVLVPMNLIAACANINAPVAGCEWVRPIIVAEADKLTTATTRVLLTHNEMYEEFCRDD